MSLQEILDYLGDIGWDAVLMLVGAFFIMTSKLITGEGMVDLRGLLAMIFASYAGISLKLYDIRQEIKEVNKPKKRKKYKKRKKKSSKKKLKGGSKK